VEACEKSRESGQQNGWKKKTALAGEYLKNKAGRQPDKITVVPEEKKNWKGKSP